MFLEPSSEFIAMHTLHSDGRKRASLMSWLESLKDRNRKTIDCYDREHTLSLVWKKEPCIHYTGAFKS